MTVAFQKFVFDIHMLRPGNGFAIKQTMPNLEQMRMTIIPVFGAFSFRFMNPCSERSLVLFHVAFP